MSLSLPLKLWKLLYAINFGWREDSSLASGGDNQCVASPSCNPLRLTKHAATTAPISIIVRFLFVRFDQWICTQILKTVKSQKSLKCSSGSEHGEPVAAPPFRL